MFDFTSRKSFEDIGEWIDWANDIKDPQAFYVLVGAKCDLVNSREVSNQEATQYAASKKMAYFVVSSKQNYQIKELFEHCIIQCFKIFKKQHK